MHAIGKNIGIISVISLSLSINLYKLLIGGVMYGGDSSRYIDGANQLLSLMPFGGKESNYISYLLFIALLKLLKLPLLFIIISQV
jgi:hypothetical protein